jgi:hypothetical protein
MHPEAAVIRNASTALQRALNGENAIPASTEIPPGPVGQNTTENMKTDFVAYGQYRRFLAGIRVEQVATSAPLTNLLHRCILRGAGGILQRFRPQALEAFENI